MREKQLTEIHRRLKNYSKIAGYAWKITGPDHSQTINFGQYLSKKSGGGFSVNFTGPIYGRTRKEWAESILDIFERRGIKI